MVDCSPDEKSEGAVQATRGIYYKETSFLVQCGEVISEQDLDFLCQVECDKELWYFEESVPSEEEARENFLEKFAVHEDEEGASYDFFVRLASNQAASPIGIAQIWSYVDWRKSWEIGFAILPEYGGRGFGREAIQR
ncbi:GNAT family N-acetyltransferase [Paenibacillus thiaminolyticus]|uniref:GNAT family N-acetyltransferase n=1 Tax=Paenibacillus thiaminolyticus TaxID=49283 RepID=UPI0021759EDA|nr:GNAT family N-acetyltransferase [Paenibacillus thiaminolyticus]